MLAQLLSQVVREFRATFVFQEIQATAYFAGRWACLQESTAVLYEHP
jgi:hypothetical protein